MSRYAFANAAHYRMQPTAETLLQLDTRAESQRLADLIGYETPAWEAFWATVPEDASMLKIYHMLREEIARVKAAQVEA
jgi:hypothetical protein